MARRNNDFLHLISLLTLYAILPSDKPKQRRPVQQVNYNPEANVSTTNSSNANNGNEGLMMFAFLLIVVGMMSGSGEAFFFCFFVAGGMFLAACCGGSKKNTSSNNQVQQGANQAYYNPDVYTYSNAQASVSQQSFVEAQANYANAQAAQPFVPINAKHVFVPDAVLVGLLQGMHINERMRYLNVDCIDELVQKFPMCLTESELADYNAGKGWILKLKRKVVADKYRYLKGMVPSSPAPAMAAAAVSAAVPMAMYLDEDDDDDNVFWSNNNQEQVPAPRPAWQDPHAYHGTEKYDEFYHLREDEYREEYGDDFEDAIDNEYEETYINNR